MKHATTRELFEHWDAMRGDEIAPRRDALTPDPVRHLIGDMFLLSTESGERFPVRVAGTRLCALAGRDIKGQDFLALWDAPSRRELADLLHIATEENIATVTGVTSRRPGHEPRYLELLLLPFVADLAVDASVAGSLVPLTAAAPGAEPTFLHDLTLTSWRHLGFRRHTIRQRAIRRLAIAKGFMVYEGSGRDI